MAATRGEESKYRFAALKKSCGRTNDLVLCGTLVVWNMNYACFVASLVGNDMGLVVKCCCFLVVVRVAVVAVVVTDAPSQRHARPSCCQFVWFSKMTRVDLQFISVACWRVAHEKTCSGGPAAISHTVYSVVSCSRRRRRVLYRYIRVVV